jgi:hypothetical protein
MTSMETPRLLSEYFAARAQSDGRISAKVVVASASATSGADAEIQGSARVSRAGERVLAIANFRCGFASRIAKDTKKKSRFWRDTQTNTRDASATRKVTWRRLLVAFGEEPPADNACATLPRLAIRPDSAVRSDRGKIASFRREAAVRGFRRDRRF